MPMLQHVTAIVAFQETSLRGGKSTSGQMQPNLQQSRDQFDVERGSTGSAVGEVLETGFSDQILETDVAERLRALPEAGVRP